MNIKRFWPLLALILCTAQLSGCGEEGVISPAGTGSTELSLGSDSGVNFTVGELEIKNSTVAANGSTVVSAYIVDRNALLSTRTNTITFTSNCVTQSLASFNATTVITTTGIASTTYIDQGCQVSDTITATGVFDGVLKTATGDVTIESTGTTPTTTRLGTGTGTGFSNGVLGISPAAISASGSAAITVNIVDGTGTLLTTTNTVTFTSTCEQLLKASFSASSVVTSNGTANTTYTTAGCTSSDTITASATIGGTAITATGTLTIAQASAGSIQFTSASNSLIALRGTGSTSGLSESASIIFTVLDSQGTPVSGEDVTFSLNSSVGGITLVSSTSTSNNNGEVVATVNSGTVATSVRVTAVVDSNTALTTTSQAIAIATGPPDQDSMSLSAETLNPRAWNLDGASVSITARVADRFNNRIQDGTAISFFTELGSIGSSCTTVNGACSVDWISQSPRTNPNVAGNAGRSTILAIVVGEESFNDANSNGVFDDGDSFTDLGEAFRDDNESNTDGYLSDGYDLANNEFFIDFNSNGIRDAANTLYNGAGCAHTTQCDTTSESVSVRDDLTLVMAEDNPAIIAVGINGSINSECISQADCLTASYPGTLNLGTTANITFTIVGVSNEQVLPVGTTVSFTTDNGKITGGATHTVPNTSSIAAGGRFTVYLAPDTTSSSGTLSIEVKIGESGGTFALPSITLTD